MKNLDFKEILSVVIIISILIVSTLLIVYISIGAEEATAFINLAKKDITGLSMVIISAAFIFLGLFFFIYVSVLLSYIIARNIFAIRIKFFDFFKPYLLFITIIFLAVILDLLLLKQAPNIHGVIQHLNPFAIGAFFVLFFMLKQRFYNITVNPLLFSLFQFSIFQVSMILY